MGQQPGKISRLGYGRAVLDRVQDRHAVRDRVFGKDSLSADVLDALEVNDVTALGGIYGDPSAGDPIEYDHLCLHHDGGITEITIYNRGILLFGTDDEVIQRIHRAFCALEKLCPGAG